MGRARGFRLQAEDDGAGNWKREMDNTLLRSVPCEGCGEPMLWTQNAWRTDDSRDRGIPVPECPCRRSRADAAVSEMRRARHLVDRPPRMAVSSSNACDVVRLSNTRGDRASHCRAAGSFSCCRVIRAPRKISRRPALPVRSRVRALTGSRTAIRRERQLTTRVAAQVTVSNRFSVQHRRDLRVILRRKIERHMVGESAIQRQQQCRAGLRAAEAPGLVSLRISPARTVVGLRLEVRSQRAVRRSWSEQRPRRTMRAHGDRLAHAGRPYTRACARDWTVEREAEHGA